MSNAERKARKRAGIRLVKQAKTPTTRYIDRERFGLGLVSGAEILAGIVVRGRL